MVFEGAEGFYMAGTIEAPRLNHSKSFLNRKRFQKDKRESLHEVSGCQKSDKGQMEKPFVRTMCESPSRKVHESLQQEILRLEKQLESQFEVRHALESALGYGSSSTNDDDDDDINAASMPKNVIELIRDIAVLEYEVGHLEQSLLSLYKMAFDQQTPAASPSVMDKNVVVPPFTDSSIIECCRPSVSSSTDNINFESMDHLISRSNKDPSIFEGAESIMNSDARCLSSILQHSSFIPRPVSDEIDAKAVRACQSQPLSMIEYAQNNSGNLVSLAEHLGTRISDHLPETPNRLSEYMIKCMSAIYCKLSDPPLAYSRLSSSNSTSSSISHLSPQKPWSPRWIKDSSFEANLSNSFDVERVEEFSGRGPYSSMVEVTCIFRDNKKLRDVKYLLQDFRSIISRLQEVDPKKLTHEERLAFWINVHNSLVMHAFLAFGIPHNNVKRVLLLLKAAYNIGGHTINAETIQNIILGCRMSRPGQWIRKLIPSRSKFKTGDELQAYAIDKPEPLVYFALSYGSHSDPAVRAYTPKKIFQELETAKKEYIIAHFSILKNQKLSLPKLVESFAKESSISREDMLKTIQQSLPEFAHSSIKKCLASNKSHKSIEWVPHNFSFRYLISKELVKY